MEKKMKILDNISNLVKDDLTETIKSHSKISSLLLHVCL